MIRRLLAATLAASVFGASLLPTRVRADQIVPLVTPQTTITLQNTSDAPASGNIRFTAMGASRLDGGLVVPYELAPNGSAEIPSPVTSANIYEANAATITAATGEEPFVSAQTCTETSGYAVPVKNSTEMQNTQARGGICVFAP